MARTSSSTRIGTRAQTASYRPAGPAHLEHAYSLARAEFQTALLVAAYELFGFSVPVRNAEMEARRPTRAQYPLLRAHPLVKRAAERVDALDAALERAIAKGRLWENTPIPDEYRWTEEKLEEYEWAYLPPEQQQQLVKEKKDRERKESEASSVEPRVTRSAKRRAEASEEDDDDESASVPVQATTEEADTDASEDEAPAPKRRRGRPPKAVVSEGEDGALDSDSPPAEVSTPAKKSITATNTKTSLVSSRSSSSESPLHARRKRGRPLKVKQEDTPLKTDDAPAEKTDAHARKASEDEAVTPGKRKRGRPRKDALPPTPPPSDSDARRATRVSKRLRRN